MHITEEKIDAQNALLKIKIEAKDYSEKFDRALKSYRKKIDMPGFRKGLVPMGVVKKRYGKSLLAEEINKMLNENIQTYIREKKLKVLGSPIPSDQQNETGDWDNPTDFEFVYELGLAPDLKVEITKKDKFDYNKIDVDKKLLDKQIAELARRYGKLSEVEKASEDDLLVGDFVELDENDVVVPGGIMNQSTITLNTMEKDVKKLFKGAKVGDEKIINPHSVSKGHDDLGRMLGVSHDVVHDLKNNFKFIVREVKRMDPAEIDQAFFDKLFGEGVVKDEKDFRERIKVDLSQGFGQDSDRLFKRDITNQLVKKYNPTLPDAFMKKWIKISNENPISDEQLENEYSEYSKGLKWQLIFNNLIESKAISLEQNEIVDRTKQMLASQYAQYGMPAPEDKELTESAMKVLANQDEGRKIYDMLYDEKFITYVKENASIKDKEVSYDKFVELASKG